ncbi:MAG: hypothetical protein MJ252_22725, partial [archaeon]|nr:hypothetical protein [archaeon]
ENAVLFFPKGKSITLPYNILFNGKIPDPTKFTVKVKHGNEEEKDATVEKGDKENSIKVNLEIDKEEEITLTPTDTRLTNGEKNPVKVQTKPYPTYYDIEPLIIKGNENEITVKFEPKEDLEKIKDYLTDECNSTKEGVTFKILSKENDEIKLQIINSTEIKHGEEIGVVFKLTNGQTLTYPSATFTYIDDITDNIEVANKEELKDINIKPGEKEITIPFENNLPEDLIEKFYIQGVFTIDGIPANKKDQIRVEGNKLIITYPEDEEVPEKISINIFGNTTELAINKLEPKYNEVYTYDENGLLKSTKCTGNKIIINGECVDTSADITEFNCPNKYYKAHLPDGTYMCSKDCLIANTQLYIENGNCVEKCSEGNATSNKLSTKCEPCDGSIYDNICHPKDTSGNITCPSHMILVEDTNECVTQKELKKRKNETDKTPKKVNCGKGEYHAEKGYCNCQPGYYGTSCNVPEDNAVQIIDDVIDSYVNNDFGTNTEVMSDSTLAALENAYNIMKKSGQKPTSRVHIVPTLQKIWTTVNETLIDPYLKSPKYLEEVIVLSNIYFVDVKIVGIFPFDIYGDTSRRLQGGNSSYEDVYELGQVYLYCKYTFNEVARLTYPLDDETYYADDPLVLRDEEFLLFAFQAFTEKNKEKYLEYSHNMNLATIEPLDPYYYATTAEPSKYIKDQIIEKIGSSELWINDTFGSRNIYEKVEDFTYEIYYRGNITDENGTFAIRKYTTNGTGGETGGNDELYETFKNLGIDIYDPNSNAYTDTCEIIEINSRTKWDYTQRYLINKVYSGQKREESGLPTDSDNNCVIVSKTVEYIDAHCKGRNSIMQFGNSKINIVYTRAPLLDDDLKNPIFKCYDKIDNFKENIALWLYLALFCLFFLIIGIIIALRCSET